jgi:hypothetical protein
MMANDCVITQSNQRSIEMFCKPMVDIFNKSYVGSQSHSHSQRVKEAVM